MYNISFRHIITLLLPPFLRKVKIKQWLSSLIAPLDTKAVANNTLKVLGRGYLIFRRIVEDYTEEVYTVERAMQISAERKLESIEGYQILGWSSDDSGIINMNIPINEIIIPEEYFKIDSLGNIWIGDQIHAIIAIATFYHPEYLSAVGGGYFVCDHQEDSGLALVSTAGNYGNLGIVYEIKKLPGLYQQFLEFRRLVLQKLSYTGQVIYLEKMLNDKYNKGQPGIYITDASEIDSIYLSNKAEDVPIFIGNRNEYILGSGMIYRDEYNNESAVYIGNIKEFLMQFDFIVHVPATIYYDLISSHLLDGMFAIINIYKLAGKHYTVIPY